MTSATGNLRELFDEAVALAPGERSRFLAERCADAGQRVMLERMLAIDAGQVEGMLDRPLDAMLERVGRTGRQPQLASGAAIGTFRVLDKLGEGGSSIVYRAEREQDGVRQLVALKLLRRGVHGEHERRRFRTERRALAALRHPGIARLIEGGVTDEGIAYIAIELVDGMPITIYALEHRLDLRARLGLFVAVCRAVEAAHRALIVHRDLKPSNVLVTNDGEVKLLDFGIAKWLDEETDDTRTQQLVMTPAYAAPEQFRRQPVTTATDVYALGVLLGELVTGVRRESGDIHTPSSQVRDSEPGVLPASPAITRRQLRGDLDNIVLKASAAEPERRYASAGAFADDVERHLAGEPVLAHPPSRWYRAGKFVARHRGGVLAAAAVAAALVAALGVTRWQANVAREEARRARVVRDFLVDLFDSARAHLPRDGRPTPEALVEEAEKQLAGKSDVAPDTRASLERTLGEVELSLSEFARAQTLFAAAAESARQADDAASVREARVLHADALQRAGKNAEALHEVNAELGALRAAPSRLLLRALAVLAATERMTGANDASIAHRREAQQVAIGLYGENGVEAIATGFEVGNALAEQEKFRDAIQVLEPLLARWRAARAPEDDRYVAALDSLATAEDGVGDLAKTEARLREVLALKRRIYTAPHDAIAKTLRDLGVVEERAEKYAEAESLMDEALAMQRKVFGDDHREVAETYNERAEIKVAESRYADAEPDFRAGIAICERTKLKEEVCANLHNNFGMALYRQNRFAEARTEIVEALAERRALHGNDHPDVAYSLSSLSNVAAKEGDYAEAERLAAESLAILERNGAGASIEAALVRFSQAYALSKAHRNEEALAAIERTLDDWRRVSPAGRTRRVSMLVQKAYVLRDLGRADEARRTADDAIALGVDPGQLSATVKKSLRELSGRADVYPEVAGMNGIAAW
jgi:serine/threonine-protein kinase